MARSACIPAFAEAIIAVKNRARFNNMTALLESLPVFQFRNTAVVVVVQYSSSEITRLLVETITRFVVFEIVNRLH